MPGPTTAGGNLHCPADLSTVTPGETLACILRNEKTENKKSGLGV